jgi:hypothetical protein
LPALNWAALWVAPHGASWAAHIRTLACAARLNVALGNPPPQVGNLEAQVGWLGGCVTPRRHGMYGISEGRNGASPEAPPVALERPAAAPSASSELLARAIRG